MAALGLFLASALGTATPGAGVFLTDSDPYLTVVDATGESVVAIITTGDALANGYTFPKIPDGIGMTLRGQGAVDVFVNHELNNGANHGGFAKVSRLKLQTSGAQVITAELVIDGSEGYERFCSASSAEGFGLLHPIYFANEEVGDGIVVAVDMRTGQLIELPWLGEFSHENTVLVPHFYEQTGQIVALSFEDGDATESEVYMYLADTAADLLEGNGQLYVFAAVDGASYNTWDDIYYATGAVDGTFEPVTWDWRTQDEDDLHAAAEATGAFSFIRPEDGAMDKREGHENVLYMADTGNDRDESGALIPAGSNGQSWDDGRIYRFEFTDAGDPTQASFEVLLDGGDPEAPGYGVMINPDNLDTSVGSLMIQEDRIGANRPAVTSPYDITKNAKILRFDLATGNLEIVAYLNQDAVPAARHGDWESSGILDASEAFGEGAWLVTVQAHSLQEGGQLLLLYVEGS